MKSFFENIVDNTIKNYSGRKIVIWGAHATAEKINTLLIDRYGIGAAFKVDGNEAKVDGIEVRAVTCLKNKSKEYYVIVPIGIYDDVRNTLKEYGYKKDKDYYYFCDCIKQENTEYFEDWHGNKIYGDRKCVKFVFSGFHSTIRIDKGFKTDGAIALYINSNSDIRLGANCAFTGKGNSIFVEDNSSVVFGTECILDADDVILRIGKESMLGFASKCRLKGENAFFEIDEKSKVVFDEGCEISGKGIVMRAQRRGDVSFGRECKLRGNDIAIILKGAGIVFGQQCNFIGNKLLYKINENACVRFEDQCIFAEDNAIFNMGGKIDVIFGRRSEIKQKNINICGNLGARIRFGEECRFDKDKLAVIMGEKSELEIKERCEFVGGDAIFRVGDGAQVCFGPNCRLGKGLNFRIGKASKFEFGDQGIIEHNVQFSLGDYVQMYVGKDAYIRREFLLCMHDNSEIFIGDQFSISYRGKLALFEFTKVHIGKDCMFSWDIIFLADDGHAIFDVLTQESLNADKDRQILIGDHVWIGARSTLLYNTKVGDGSIIGAGSIVKNEIPNNCIAAGNPAKVVRKNIAWSRKNVSKDISSCGEENINLTSV